MAELTREQVDASLARVEQYALGDDDVALQTAATLPASVKVKGTVLGSAGNDSPGNDPVVSYSAKQVRQMAEQWSGSGRGRRGGGRRATSPTDRRTTRGRRAAARQGRVEAPGATVGPESDQSADQPRSDQDAAKGT